MTHQLDMMPGALVDPAVLDRIEDQLPKAREVKPRFVWELIIDTRSRHSVVDRGIERAREDHR